MSSSHPRLTRIVSCVVLVSATSFAAISAQTQPSSSAAFPWANVFALHRNQKIVLSTDRQPTFDALFQESDDASITVIKYRGNGNPERIPRAIVQEILTNAPNPLRKRGAALAAVGIAAMIIGAAAKDPEAGPSAGFVIGLPLALIGGATYDHANKRPIVVTIYRRS